MPTFSPNRCHRLPMRLASLLTWLRSFIPAPLTGTRRDVWVGCLGAGLGLLVTEWISHQTLGSSNPWFIAPMGASAVLLFAMPASPLAQPWSIVGGNVIAALVGVTCVHFLGSSGPVAALAAAVTIGLMFPLRCLHPPGGAVALTAVLGGPSVHALGWSFAIWPVAVDSVLMVVMAVLFNSLAGHRYPHHGAPRPHPHGTRDLLPTQRVGPTSEDLDKALASFGEVLDIDRDDLEDLVMRTNLAARRRQWQAVRCRDIMSRDVVHVAPGDSVDEAWRRLAHHKVKALPVVDAIGRLVGIVSLHDFFIGHHQPSADRLPCMTKAQRIEEIMTRRVRTALPEQTIGDLVKGFSDGGLHHMPVVDDDDHLVGMVTQSDLVAALFMRSPL